MLEVTRPWWMYLNLKIYDCNPVICSVRMIILAVLWDQHKNCWTRKLFVRNYSKEMICSEFETDIDICSCSGCPLPFSHAVRTRWDAGSCFFAQHLLAVHILTCCLYFTAVNVQKLHHVLNMTERYFISCGQGFTFFTFKSLLLPQP